MLDAVANGKTSKNPVSNGVRSGNAHQPFATPSGVVPRLVQVRCSFASMSQRTAFGFHCECA
jgi:hypothetical protein